MEKKHCNKKKLLLSMLNTSDWKIICGDSDGTKMSKLWQTSK